MSKQAGFTVIELIVAFIVLAVLTVFFVLQRNDLEATARDATRKTAINAMYYALTEDFYVQNQYYPRTISRDNLKSIDPTLFTDPIGFTLNGDQCVYTDLDGEQATDGECDYRYTAENCDGDGHCKSFKLTAILEKEATYEKSK
jgi:type II secretory pathway pseudopilin PulG